MGFIKLILTIVITKAEKFDKVSFYKKFKLTVQKIEFGEKEAVSIVCRNSIVGTMCKNFQRTKFMYTTYTY